MLVGEEAVHSAGDKRLVDGESVDGAAGQGVGDDRAARDDDGVALVDGGHDVGGFNQTPTGTDDGGDACGPSLEEGLKVARGDAPILVQEGAVKVDGEEGVAGWHGGG